MAKILLGVSILFMLLSAVLGFLTKSKIADLHADIDTAKSASASMSAQANKAQADAKAAQAQVATLNQQIQTSSQSAQTLQASLDAATKDRDQANKDLGDAKTQITDLTQKLATAASQPQTSGSAAIPAEITAKLDEQATKLKEAQEISQKLTQQNASLQSEIDDYKKIRETSARQANARALSGEVLAVQPSWNFVIISLGDRQGMTMNAPLVVKRDGSMVAKLKVTSVEPTTSVADIVSSSVPLGMHVLPGDRVIYSGPGPMP